MGMVDERLRIDSSCPHPYFVGMPPRRRTSKDTPAKLASRMRRRWRVVLLRSKGQVLGEVEAPGRGSGRSRGGGPVRAG
jgi:hypothetical protein